MMTYVFLKACMLYVQYSSFPCESSLAKLLSVHLLTVCLRQEKLFLSCFSSKFSQLLLTAQMQNHVHIFSDEFVQQHSTLRHDISICVHCWCNKLLWTQRFKQHRRIVLQFWMSKIENESHWVEIHVMAKPFFSFLQARGENPFLAFSSFRRLPHSLADGPFLHL